MTRHKGNIEALIKAVDEYIPIPERPVDLDFLMPIEDVFSNRGSWYRRHRPYRARHPQEDGRRRDRRHPRDLKTTVTDIEMFRKLLDEGRAGDNVGLLLRGTKKDEIERGQVIAKPGSITPHKCFKSEVYVLSKDEGGRHTPFFSNYRPAVLLPHDRRDRQHQAPGRRRDGHAGR